MPRSRFPTDGSSIQVLNQEIDLKWGGGARSRTMQSYYDYYYTGQDIKIYVEGTEQPEGSPELPIMQFAYSVEQKKMPLYGHASHTYDAVMRGNRLVTGAFTIATTQANYMTSLLTLAATARLELEQSGTQIAPLKKDLQNIQRYWNVNTDNSLSPGGFKNIFNSHPPFNFIIVIGLQPESAGIINAVTDWDAISNMYSADAVLTKDINERLWDSDPEGENRRLIQNVELIKLDNAFSTDGEILGETYSFFARDEFPLN